VGEGKKGTWKAPGENMILEDGVCKTWWMQTPKRKKEKEGRPGKGRNREKKQRQNIQGGGKGGARKSLKCEKR